MTKNLIENRDPISLVKSISELTQTLQLQQVDKRALVSLQGASGQTWTGVPSSIVENQNGQFVILASSNDDRIQYVMLSQVVALEIENVRNLRSFLARPWIQDPKYTSLSKFQAAKELEALGQSFNGVQFVFHFDTLPAGEDLLGDAVAWVASLKSTLEKMGHDPVAKEAIAGIQSFDIKYNAGGLKGQKSGSALMFQVDLKTECFNPGKIEELLNSLL
jgi:hypothetical protein